MIHLTEHIDIYHSILIVFNVTLIQVYNKLNAITR